MLLGIFYLTGCGTDKTDLPKTDQEKVSDISKKIISKNNIQDVSLSYQITKLGDQHYKIEVESNLPDSVELMIGLTNQAQLEKKMNLPAEPEQMTDKQFADYMKALYNGSGKCLTKDGKATVELTGKNLNAGDYQISISCSTMNFQNDKIKEIFGVNGERLQGKYVTDGKLGRNISLEETVKI